MDRTNKPGYFGATFMLPRSGQQETTQTTNTELEVVFVV